MVSGVERHAHAQAVLHASLAERCAWTRLDAADAYTDDAAGVHAQVGPDRIDVLFPDAKQSDPGGAGDLDLRDVVPLGHVGNSAQRLGRHHPARNVRRNPVRLPVPL